MKKIPRNNKYCPEVTEAICASIADGLSASEIERDGIYVEGKLMKVSKDSITEWKRRYPEFRQALANARDVSDLGLFDRVMDLCNLDLADEAKKAAVLEISSALQVQYFTQRCNQVKEQISNIWRRLKILKPEKYGDRIMQDIDWKSKIDDLSKAKIEEEIYKIAGATIEDIQKIFKTEPEKLQ